jgi:hypothetical protein
VKGRILNYYSNPQKVVNNNLNIKIIQIPSNETDFVEVLYRVLDFSCLRVCGADLVYVCPSGETVNEPSQCPIITSPPETNPPTTTTSSTTSTSTILTTSPPPTVPPTSLSPTTPPPPTVSEKDPCPTSPENPITHGSTIVSEVYICKVIFTEEDNWQVVLYNQGDEDIILDHYKLKDYDNKFYLDSEMGSF